MWGVALAVSGDRARVNSVASAETGSTLMAMPSRDWAMSSGERAAPSGDVDVQGVRDWSGVGAAC